MHDQARVFEPVDSSKWYLDSAASHHYCNDKRIMYDLQPTNIDVQVGDGSSVNIQYLGRVDLEVTDQNGDTHVLKLSNVRYSNRFASNLLSVRQALHETYR
ncbi:hypothetical protein V1507DRAFT_438656 [Lipomyces tetrasporus]